MTAIKTLIRRALCRVFGHDDSFVLTGTVTRNSDDHGLDDVRFTDDAIVGRCDRCGAEREPTDKERQQVMRELIYQQTGVGAR